ncbi:MAG TPA: 2'-5' RNA ligase family protein [Candidatus Saccharimonadaceae bacterium]|nr:2'-5' RNA ligase family protein [Candidatus Saccharimonadaceae bacterium]
MVYSQKYCLVQPIAPMQLGDEFDASNWPLHVTIAGVFALAWTDDSHEKFADIVTYHKVFNTVTADIAYFGPQKTIKVRRLTMTPELYALHDAVVTFVEECGGSFNEPHYLRKDFVPHATMRGTEPPANQTVSFHQLALIDMFPDGDHTRRKIIRLLPLAT